MTATPATPATPAASATRTASAAPSGQTTGILATCVATLAWGSGSVAVKAITASSVTIVLWRFVVAVPLLLGILFAARRRLRLADLRRSAAGGLLFGLHVLVFFSAVHSTSVADVTFIGALQPVLVLFVAGRMFGERVTVQLVAWSVVGIGGVALVVASSADTAGTSLSGDLLAVLNLFVWTAYFLVSKRTREKVAALEYQTGVILWAAALMVPIGLAASNDVWAMDTQSDWAWLLFVTAGSGTLGHLLMNWAHKYVPASISSLVILAVPFVAATGAALFLGEQFTPLAAVGGVLVLLATGAVVRRTPPEPVDELPAASS